MTTTIITLISVYILSAYFYWLHTKIAHSKGGRWEGQYPNYSDLIVTIIPIINTFSAIIRWGITYPYKRKDFSKFFNIKK